AVTALPHDKSLMRFSYSDSKGVRGSPSIGHGRAMATGRQVPLQIGSGHTIPVPRMILNNNFYSVTDSLTAAADIVLQLFDHEFLLGNHLFHQVTDGNEPQQLAVFHHRQVTN